MSIEDVNRGGKKMYNGKVADATLMTNDGNKANTTRTLSHFNIQGRTRTSGVNLQISLMSE